MNTATVNSSKHTDIEKRVHAIMAAFVRPWRWFCDNAWDGTWIVLEPPQGLIDATTMHYVHQCADTYSVEAVFRATPHPGVYLRFRLHEVTP